MVEDNYFLKWPFSNFTAKRLSNFYLFVFFFCLKTCIPLQENRNKHAFVVSYGSRFTFCLQRISGSLTEIKKIHKICRDDLRAFALRNYSEGYKINKPLFGLLVYRRLMPSAKRLSSKFHSCPWSFASRPTVHFSDNLSLGHCPLIYQPPKGVYLLNVHITVCTIILTE